MKFEKLELHGYKRLMLSNINHFVYTPTASIQLILGTNGSGKSSILSELSPLPAQAADYSKDGYKKCWLSHRGADYQLSSTFQSGNKHSFIKNGEELNAGGTAQVQKELVKREFSITPELHELLIGQLKFTDMMPMKRREWITMLSTVDYTYAIQTYNNVRGLARDQQGALKHLKQRLVQETNNLKSLADCDGVEGRLELLRNELNLLLSARTPGLQSYPDMSNALDACMREISGISDQILSMTTVRPVGIKLESLDELREEIQRLDSAITSNTSMLNRYTSEYSDLESLTKSVGNVEDISIDNLEGLMLGLENEIALKESELQVFLDLKDVASIRDDNAQILGQVIQLFKTIPDNKDRRYSKDSAARAKAEITAQQNIVNAGCARLLQIETRLSNIRSAKDLTCPNCSYVWREGVSPLEIKQNEEWAQEHEHIVDVARRKIAVEEAFLAELEEYSLLFKQFKGYVVGYPRLKPLWDHLLHHNYLTDNPQEHVGIFFIWQKDVEVATEIELQRQKLRRLQELAARQTELGGLAIFNQHLAKLQRSIEDVTDFLHSTRRQVKDVRQFGASVAKIQAAADKLDSLVSTFIELRSKTLEALRNREIDTVVSEHQNELAIIQRKVTERRAAQDIVTDLTASNADVDLDQKALSLIAQALSPVEGLVAEQLTGFIRCLTAQINSVIQAVWTYDLIVLPCGLDTGELDYKFPLQVNAATNIVPDISKGSTAIREIVNFAFLLTAMLYLDLDDYPLYLDELGAGFDEQHRSNVMGFVKQLIDTNRHSQLFMISHYAANHGALTSAQVLVLDASNIAVPGTFNENVVLV